MYYDEHLDVNYLRAKRLFQQQDFQAAALLYAEVADAAKAVGDTDTVM